MADPLWINVSSGAPAYTANELRQAMALALMYDGRALGARSGVRAGGTGLTVSVVGSTITVQPGVACIDPGLSTPQGPYWVAIPAAETPGPLTAADASNPRKDIVIARVYDHDEDSSGLRLARTEYITGVANPSPVRPGLPSAGSIRLATIDVPKVGSGSAVVTNDYPYTVAAGAILPVRAATDIAPAVAGRYRHRLDTGQLERDTGSAWIPIEPLLKRKTSDEGWANSTLHNDNELFINVADANTVYALDVYLRYLSPASPGIKFKWSVPSGTFVTWQDVNSGRTELRETDTLTIATAGGLAENVRFHGTVSVGATPGQIRLQWAQSVTNATATNVQSLSWMQMQRLP